MRNKQGPDTLVQNFDHVFHQFFLHREKVVTNQGHRVKYIYEIKLQPRRSRAALEVSNISLELDCRTACDQEACQGQQLMLQVLNFQI